MCVLSAAFFPKANTVRHVLFSWQVEIAEEEAQKMLCVRDAVEYIEAHK